jgi:indolepyruvate ferredoxin oxidoreductase beta subunit
MNMILLGATTEFLGLGEEKIAESIKTVFAAKGEAVVEMNIKALELGRTFK